MKSSVKCIIKNDEEILFIRPSAWPEGWVLPGGTVEKGETVEEAAFREMREEINVMLHNVKKFAELRINEETIYCFECDILDKEEVKVDGKEAIEAQWFKILKLPTVLGTRTKQVISSWRNRKNNF